MHRPDVRQPRSWTLTAHPTPANLLPRANLDAQGGLDFLSVGFIDFEASGLDAYTELDLRAGWRLRDDLELSLVGRNLLASRHAEFLSDMTDLALTGIERSVYAKLDWHF